MENIDKLVDDILKYEAEYNWYELINEYGNIATDDEAKKTAIKNIRDNIQENPSAILNSIKDDMEEMNTDEKMYKEAQDLVIRLKSISKSNNIIKNIKLKCNDTVKVESNTNIAEAEDEEER